MSADQSIIRVGWKGTGALVLWAALLPAPSAPGAGPEPLPPPVRETLSRHCLDCHDAATSKGGLSLEGLAPRFDDRSTLERWVRVHDRVAHGEMPPADKPQPTAREREAMTSWLRDRLTTASRTLEQTEGRARLRRLNRLEYIHTLEDLLSIHIDLEDILPPDRETGGFDKMSLGLEVSPRHLLRYQEAAQQALDAAFPTSPPAGEPVHRRITGREWRESARAADPDLAEMVLTPAVRLEGEVALIHAQSTHHPHLQIPAGVLALPGRYRIRLAAEARNTHGSPIGVLFTLSGFDPLLDVTQQRILDVRDVAPSPTPGGGKPAIVELEIEVPWRSKRLLGRTVSIAGWTLPAQKQPGALRAAKFLGEKPDFTGPALAVHWVEFEGPVGDFPPDSYRRLFDDLPIESRWTASRKAQGLATDAATLRGRPPQEWATDPLLPVPREPGKDAERLVRAFARRAFRGETSRETLDPFLRQAADQLARGEAFHEAMLSTYRAMLCSLHSLCIAAAPGPLSPRDVATRLSYFLWSSCPDETLLLRAERGGLGSAADLREEVDRMLADPRARRFTREFTGQWLDLRKYFATRPDAVYAEFDEQLLWSMPRETEAFFEEMLRGNRDVIEFVDSDWTYLNGRLAQHYGILMPGGGLELRRQALPAGSHRGGVITQAAILKVTANGTTTSPVIRGKWILERILGTPPRRPPSDVAALEPDIRGATTVRQQLERHRSIDSCNRCHRWIDPPGFALESFDVIGGWRDWYRVGGFGLGRTNLPHYPQIRVSRGLPVEAGYTMADGRSFSGIDDYRRLLAADRVGIARNLVAKLAAYATGGEVEFADRDLVEEIARRPGLGLRSLIEAIVESRLFLEQ